jgi:Holliday junction resolvase-like predicted endonuclease
MRNKKQPGHKVDFALLSRVGYEVWPKEYFNTIESVNLCKQFYNLSYNRLIEELNLILNKFHPAAWVREAYIQLELWSFIFYNNEHKAQKGIIKGLSFFAPIGRYGWRYILEISLEKVAKANVDNNLRPQDNDVSKVFTLLLALSYCSEFSNYLHYFKSYFTSVKVQISPLVYSTHPKFNESENKFFEKIIDYIHEKPDWKKYKQFSIDNDMELMKMVDRMLGAYFKFTLNDVRSLIAALVNEISHRLGASILITTFDEAVDLFAHVCDMPPAMIESILNFVLLDVQSPTHTSRDFLSRSQQRRMLNYAGVLIYLNKNYETIYDRKSAKFDYVVKSDKHIILTSTLLIEWLDVFVSRLVYGQRQDLKNINNEINQEISLIEKYFHINIFEVKLKELLTNKGFLCLSLEKIDGMVIPCGEIDIIAYHPMKKIFYVVEAKNHAPAKDARSMGKVISDHFKQKKYHQKFMSKIQWVNQNKGVVSKLILRAFNTEVDPIFKIENYFITGSSNAVKFIVDEYKVLTFYEFDKLLSE